LSLVALRVFSAKADAKVQQKTEPTKLFPLFFDKKQKVFALLDNTKTFLPILIEIIAALMS
nr:hypothetical protein [Prevotella sp.]